MGKEAVNGNISGYWVWKRPLESIIEGVLVDQIKVIPILQQALNDSRFCWLVASCSMQSSVPIIVPGVHWCSTLWKKVDCG